MTNPASELIEGGELALEQAKPVLFRCSKTDNEHWNMTNLVSVLFVCRQIAVKCVGDKVISEWKMLVDIISGPLVKEQVQQTLITTIKTTNSLGKLQQLIKPLQ